jgi:diguanylate cyclase (GGDEF)-like protein/PAS domain S-box-containing protein
LLIEDDPADAELIKTALAELKPRSFSLVWVTSFAAGLDRLRGEGADVVLLDLSLPDGSQVEMFDRICAAAPGIPVLMLTAPDDQAMDARRAHGGYYDSILKSRIDGYSLSRALGYLIANKCARDALLHGDARFRAISDASPLGIVVFDPEGECTYTNSAYERISGLGFEYAQGRRWFESIHRDDRERVLSSWHEATRNREPFEAEYRFLQPGGGVVWVRVNAAPMQVGERLLGYVKTVEDFTDRKAMDDALFLEKERAEVTLKSIGDGVLTTDFEGHIAYLNPIAEKLTGWSQQEALGRPFSEVLKLIDATTREPGINPLDQAVREDRPVELMLNSMLIRRDGSELRIEDSAAPIHDREGKVTGGVMVFHDASESRTTAIKMTHLAEHDALTDLPNRVLLNDRLTQAIALARRHAKKVALLFLDLDHFKKVNDSLGHAAGDKLLQAVATRLTACVRTSDTVSRQGGDEFLVLLSEIVGIHDATRFAEKISAALAMPQLIGGKELRITASIGISIYPDHGETVEKIVHHADIAMYHAKAHGRNQYHFFTHEMNAAVV